MLQRHYRAKRNVVRAVTVLIKLVRQAKLDENGDGTFDVPLRSVVPLDTGVAAAGPQIVSVTRDVKGTLKLLDPVGTFNAASPIELRGAAAVAGQSTQGFAPFGAAGFNSPSLLGLGTSAPYFHDGSAQTLEEVAAKHLLDGGQTITQKLNAQDLGALLIFLRGIDEHTATIASDADRFLQ